MRARIAMPELAPGLSTESYSAQTVLLLNTVLDVTIPVEARSMPFTCVL